MAVRCVVMLAFAVSAFQEASARNTSPISKVIEMLSDLKSKIGMEAKEAQRLFEETTNLCSDRSKQLQYEIKTGGSSKLELEAKIADDTAKLTAVEDTLEQLAADIASDESDLKAATEIRKREAADFVAQEKELMEVVGTIERAIGVLERDMQKNSASLLQQTKKVTNIAQALSLLVDATGISTTEGRRLTALVQSFQTAQSSDEEDEVRGAPDAAAYEGKSGNIIATLESLQSKAEAKLSELRTAETSALHNYDLLKQSLSDEISFANSELDAAKRSKAESNERKATAEGELESTTQDLKSDIVGLDDLKQTCASKSQDFEAGMRSRTEEIKVLTQAMSVMSKMVNGADAVAYGLSQVSFLQNSILSRTDLVNFEAVRLVRDLARKFNAPTLAQLAIRMSASMNSNNAQDPFGKVRGLIKDMIAKLKAEAAEEAQFKEHCDKELADTEKKRIEKSTEVDYLTTKIDQMSSRAAKLKNDVAALQNGVAEIVGLQGEIDKLRKEENDEFKKNRIELDRGLEGVKTAIKILTDYYSKDGIQGHESEGSSIVGMLEVIESDLAKGLTEITTTEDAAAAAHYSQTTTNAVEKKSKEMDIKYKVKEAAELDRDVAEAKSDLQGVQSQLSPVLSYLAMLKKQCVAKPESYEERSARRQAEIAGLKEALKILEEETAFMQRHAHNRRLRGAARK